MCNYSYKKRPIPSHLCHSLSSNMLHMVGCTYVWPKLVSFIKYTAAHIFRSIYCTSTDIRRTFIYSFHGTIYWISVAPVTLPIRSSACTSSNIGNFLYFVQLTGLNEDWEKLKMQKPTVTEMLSLWAIFEHRLPKNRLLTAIISTNG